MKALVGLGFIAVCLLSTAVGLPVHIPSVELKNAARPGTWMPIIGLGTGAYGRPNGTNGEYWDDDVAEAAVSMWLALGGRRIDTSLRYYNDIAGVGRALVASGIPRKDVFITSKVDIPMLYNDTLDDIDSILENLQTDYVDLVLIHWPSPPKPFTMQRAQAQYSNTRIGETICDLHTQSNWTWCREEVWKALEKKYNEGKIRAIGVANFEVDHLEGIYALGGLVPAVNQIEFHPYWHELDLLKYCQDRNITVNGYAPLGAPDYMAWQKSRWPTAILNQTAIIELAQKYSVTPAQLVLKWSLQHGVVVNPRSRDPVHMVENLNILNFQISETDMNTISSVPKPTIPKVCPDPRQLP